MSLLQKFFVFMIAGLLLPVLIAFAIITHKATKITSEVDNAISGMENAVSGRIVSAANNMVATTTQEIDLLTQQNWERMTETIARQIAAFLYARDNELLVLASLLQATSPTDAMLRDFREKQQVAITIPARFRYDQNSHQWQRISPKPVASSILDARNRENSRSFHGYIQPHLAKQPAALWKEITIISLDGVETVKASAINSEKQDITDRHNTFAASETYFPSLSKLGEGEIYVSEVIGAYVGTDIIGPYTAPRLAQANKPFTPRQSGYAGLENPVGKPFQGIIRFATPLFRDGRKYGYLTMALDHRHIMQFTDTLVPEQPENPAPDAQQTIGR